MENDNFAKDPAKPAGSEDSPLDDAVNTVSNRRRRSLKIDKEKAVAYVLEHLDQDQAQIADRLRQRKERYAKYRGWLVTKDWPWDDCANFWLPVMLISSLQIKSTLENAIKSTRPTIISKAHQRRNQPKQVNIDRVLDHQFYNENNGENKIDALVNNFVDDEAVFGFVHWVKDEQSYRDIRILPALEQDADVTAQLLQNLRVLLPTVRDVGIVQTDEDGWEWEVEFEDDDKRVRSATVKYYELDDGKLEAELIYNVTAYDGPVVEVLDFEDVVFPLRSANLQPPLSANPLGASYVSRLCVENLDSIKRHKRSGVYDLLTDEDLDKIEASQSSIGTGQPEEKSKEQKDTPDQTGFLHSKRTDRQIVEWYGPWDVDGDGFDEECILWIARDAKVLLRARILNEVYPGVPATRPIESDSFTPVPNRIYGMGLLEMLESFQDAMQALLNQHIDWGTVVNTPWFFYRASSGMKPEVISPAPGEGIAVDNPQDVNFPQFPQRGDAFTINTMTMLQQFVERITAKSDVSFGRVPAGKASAYRTTGTTQLLLGQSDARTEQILRRLFHLLARIYRFMHRLNQKFLPDKKEVRVFGVPEQSTDAYLEVTPDSIRADVDMEFKASLLNTNKQVLAAALNEAIAMLVSPLALQAGLVTPEQIYKLFSDKLKSNDLDPDQYMVRPPSQGPKLLAEEVESILMAHEIPFGQPMENLQEHLQKLLAFEQSDNFGFIPVEMIPAYQNWKIRIQTLLMEQMAMMQAAQGMAPESQQGGGGAGVGQQATQPGGAPVVQNNEISEGSLDASERGV